MINESLSIIDGKYSVSSLPNYPVVGFIFGIGKYIRTIAHFSYEYYDKSTDRIGIYFYLPETYKNDIPSNESNPDANIWYLDEKSNKLVSLVKFTNILDNNGIFCHGFNTIYFKVPKSKPRVNRFISDRKILSIELGIPFLNKQVYSIGDDYLSTILDNLPINNSHSINDSTNLITINRDINSKLKIVDGILVRHPIKPNRYLRVISNDDNLGSTIRLTSPLDNNTYYLGIPIKGAIIIKWLGYHGDGSNVDLISGSVLPFSEIPDDVVRVEAIFDVIGNVISKTPERIKVDPEVINIKISDSGNVRPFRVKTYPSGTKFKFANIPEGIKVLSNNVAVNTNSEYISGEFQVLTTSNTVNEYTVNMITEEDF